MTNHPNRSRTSRTLSDAVSEYRDRHDLTQEALADDLGVPLKAVQNWAGKDGAGLSSMSRALITCLDRL